MRGGPFKQFITTSKSPSLSRSASAMPCEIDRELNPHRSPTSSKVKFPRLRKAALGVYPRLDTPNAANSCCSTRVWTRLIPPIAKGGIGRVQTRVLQQELAGRS